MSEIKFETIESGDLFKWDEVGKNVSGILLNYQFRPDTGKGPGNIYEVKTKNGTVSFFAPFILHKKLRDVACPSIVEITMTEVSKTKTGNDLKLFDVKVAPATEANCKLLGIELVKKEEVGSDFGDL
jgi:hypothetical protein